MKLLITKLFFGKEALGALVLWLVCSVTLIAQGDARVSLLAVAGIGAIFFARYPDADIPFHLVRRELIRQWQLYGRLGRWTESRWVTACATGMALASMALAPILLLALFGAPLFYESVVLISIGILLASARAWQYHEAQAGSHWLYGHYPVILIPVAGLMGYQLGSLMGAPWWYISLLFALATFWHFSCDALQEDLGVPWLAPFIMRIHMTVRGTVIDVDRAFGLETKMLYANLHRSWYEELLSMARNEGCSGSVEQSNEQTKT